MEIDSPYTKTLLLTKNLMEEIMTVALMDTEFG